MSHRRPFRTALVLFSLALLPCARAVTLPGDPDTSFFDTGFVSLPLERAPWIRDLVRQPDGKLVLTGYYRNVTDTYLAVYRLHPDGTPDTTFNSTGGAFTDHTFPANSGFRTLVQTDGKALIYAAKDWHGYGLDTAVFRYLPNGTLDPAFGSGTGFTTVHFPEARVPRSFALQNDSKILITAEPSGFARLLPDGTLDSSFGTGGLVTTSATGGGFALAVQPDGKILTGGTGGAGDSISHLYLYRFNTDGTPDPSFGQAGRASLTVTGDSPEVDCLTLQTGGKILLGGRYDYDYIRGQSQARFFAARLLPGGEPDISFNATGWNGCESLSFNGTAFPDSLLVQSDGRIILAGVTSDSYTGQTVENVSVRFHANGAIDTGFGNGGKLDPAFNFGQTTFSGAALLPDGKLLTAGHLQGGFFLARFHLGPWPGLSVEQPLDTPLTSHAIAPHEFGALDAGSGTKEFVLRNTGSVPFTGISLSLTEESHAGEFVFTRPPDATLAPGAHTTFTVTFTPSPVAGPRTSRLLISGTGYDPFSLGLHGTRTESLQTWREFHFGSPNDSGPGADFSDFDGDGLVNLLEYAIAADPLQPSVDAGFIYRSGSSPRFAYWRPVSARGLITYQIESAPAPEGPWAADPATPIVAATGGNIYEMMEISAPDGAGRRFYRVRITR